MDREFFRDVTRGPQSQPKKDAVRERIVELRKENLSVYDIRDELERSGKDTLSATAIREVLREEGFARLPRRADEERPTTARPLADAVADVREFTLPEEPFTTRAGGLFLFLPILARLGVDELVTKSRFPGTKMIPAPHAVRSALILKLLGKSRRSHIMDLVFDRGVALAAGLNAVPKTTYMSQYSSRLGRKAIASLLGAWVERLRQDGVPSGESFNLDFHSIPYFGEDPFVEKHYVARRGQSRRSVLAFLAQDFDARLFCYSNADLRKGEEAGEVLRFVEFWKKRFGERPKHLVFDSRLTTYANLSKLNELGITFITLRRRSRQLGATIASLPSSAWRTVTLDIPHRKYKTPRVVDDSASLQGYSGKARQLFIRDLGRDEPTILLTNDLNSTARDLITRYARRVLIENGLSESVNFFHLDALSSAVALNVDFDVLLTVIASAVYRILARSLHGFEAAQAPQVFRRFLDTTARVGVVGQEVVVTLPRRAHNPLLIDAGLIGPSTPIPWWGGRGLRIEIR
jgi:hypothetical protein